MTPADLTSWLAAMKAAGLAPSKGAAADLLGITKNTMTNILKHGADRRTALACAALLLGAEPYAAPNDLDGDPPETEPSSYP